MVSFYSLVLLYGFGRWVYISILEFVQTDAQYRVYMDVASDVGVNFKNVGVLSIESSLFHLFHYTFLQTKHQRKGY